MNMSRRTYYFFEKLFLIYIVLITDDTSIRRSVDTTIEDIHIFNRGRYCFHNNIIIDKIL